MNTILSGRQTVVRAKKTRAPRRTIAVWIMTQGAFWSPRASNQRGQKRFFFQHYGLTEHDLEHYLAAALSQVAITPTFIRVLSSTSLMVDESMVKSASQGFRPAADSCDRRRAHGYAYTDDLFRSEFCMPPAPQR